MPCKMSKSKKKRLPNFSNQEKNIIENKKTDNVSVKNKEKCWINITKKFNRQLEKKTRKHYAEIRSSKLFKTGEGKMNIIKDPIAEMIKNIIQPTVEGLQNRFDSDTDDLQYSKKLENEDCYQVEVYVYISNIYLFHIYL
ncbi:hypothetical protein ACFW04_014314 [Cataglyphis niger]